MTAALPLTLVGGRELAGLSAPQVLGGFGLGQALPAQTSPWPVQWLQVPLQAPVSGSGDAVWQECLLAAGETQSGELAGVRWRRHGDLLFGVVECLEPDPRPMGGLQALGRQAYERVFQVLDAQRLPHLWRVWNYMPDIHGEEVALERYRQFNLGRAQAFEQAARTVEGKVPAACALGVADGPLSVAFLAGATPVITIENPRQVAAWRYPHRYGPQSPTFSRAALAHPPGQEWLFISGTASIVGHETVHHGDVREQTRETLRNIDAVIAQANAEGRSGRFERRDLVFRAYVRHAEDVPAVREVMAAAWGITDMVCVQADICRRDLLVEIEAMGWRPLGRSVW